MESRQANMTPLHILVKKNLFLFFIVLSGLMSCITTNDLATGFSMQVIKSNSTPKIYKKIMIAGYGTSFTRLFFENLYAALSTELLKANIATEKKFTGDDSFSAVYAGNNFKGPQRCDAVFIVEPKPTDFAAQKNTVNSARRNQPEKDFKLTIFDNTEIHNSIWELNLNINIDFAQAKPYQVVAEKIVENMRLNKIVR